MVPTQPGMDRRVRSSKGWALSATEQAFHGMNPKGIRVFVTDGYWRKTLAAVRGLGRTGMRVTVGESTYLAPACFSRYCHTRVRTPSPVLQPSAYLEFLEDYLNRHPHQVLLPMEEETLLLLAHHRTRFERLTRLPVADHASLLVARDKLQVLQRAEALSIPIPQTYPVADLEAGRALLDTLPYPVVVKPRVGSGSAGIEYVTERAQLLPALRRAFAAAHAPFIQERLPAAGAGIGVSFLLDEGHQVRASFVHRRLREYPVSGGPSTLRESCMHEEARKNALRLLQDLNFVGVAMVEFKIDARTGQPKLLEVNPRFWGSLALAIDAGVNFPYLLTLMALGQDFTPVNRYRLGHRCRWLLPGDLLHFLQNPNRWHLEPSFFRFRAPRLTYDIIDARDPGPILGTLLSLLPFYGSRDFLHVRRRRT
jgi:predicted ATP-grasp superfamily ATP-dependent carboligase